MARVTVEDCIEKLPNRFELVMMAAQRARKIGSGAALTIPKDNDKNPVIALREIAGETIAPALLKEEIVSGYQRYLPQDEADDAIDLFRGLFAVPDDDDDDCCKLIWTMVLAIAACA